MAHFHKAVLLCVTLWSNAELRSQYADDCSGGMPILEASLTRQLLLTPGFLRGRYRPNLDCRWVIRSTLRRNYVQLTVANSQFEDRLFEDCDDFIEVFDGESNKSRSIIRWCGVDHPLSMIGSSGSLYVHFKSDGQLESRGANMSYSEFRRDPPECPFGWSDRGKNCYRIYTVNGGRTWVEAQLQCNLDGANLLTVVDKDELPIISELLSPRKELNPWIGYEDAQLEGSFKSVDHRTKAFPKPFPSFSGAHDQKDCVYWDNSKSAGGDVPPYGVEDCRQRRPFVCERRKDGSTVAVPPPQAAVRQGYAALSRANYEVLRYWPAFVALLVILLLILATVCYNACHHRDGGRSIRSSRVGILVESESPAHSPNATKVVVVGQDEREGPAAQTPPAAEQNAKDEKNFSVDEISVTNHVARHMALPTLKEERRPNGKPATAAVVPLDRFDRPHVKVLDNVSAISMDEFWSKAEQRHQPSSRLDKATSRNGTILVAPAPQKPNSSPSTESNGRTLL